MGNINASIQQFILYMVALIFSLSVHESAHAWMSNKFGDDLARLQGRISLNPVSHVDPIGTLLFPAIAFFTGAPLIGWAKPTPVNPLKWRNKRVANFWVSAAGAISNFIIAIIAGIGIRMLYVFGISDGLEMRPDSTGSSPNEATIGVMRVARRAASCSQRDIRSSCDHLSEEGHRSLGLALGRSALDRDCTSLDPTKIAQAALERSHVHA